MSEEARPPFVTFEVRAIEDRTESLAQGHYVPKDVYFAIITPAGSKDRIEKVAEDWLKDLEEGVRQERFSAEWLRQYRKAFEGWVETRQMPEFGTSVMNWPALSPAQVRILQDSNLLTIESVAEANEESIQRMGMGGRALKSRAQAWLDSIGTTGKVSAQLDELRAQVERLTLRDTEREEELRKLQEENQALAESTPAKVKA